MKAGIRGCRTPAWWFAGGGVVRRWSWCMARSPGRTRPGRSCAAELTDGLWWPRTVAAITPGRRPAARTSAPTRPTSRDCAAVPSILSAIPTERSSLFSPPPGRQQGKPIADFKDRDGSGPYGCSRLLIDPGRNIKRRLTQHQRRKHIGVENNHSPSSSNLAGLTGYPRSS